MSSTARNMLTVAYTVVLATKANLHKVSQSSPSEIQWENACFSYNEANKAFDELLALATDEEHEAYVAAYQGAK